MRPAICSSSSCKSLESGATTGRNTGHAGGAGETSLADEVARDRPIHDAEHERQRVRISRQQEPQRMGQREHPLPQRAFGQYLISQQRRGLGHSPPAAGRAEPALLAAERHQLLGMTLLATHTQESLLQPSALEIRVKLLLHEIQERPVGRGAQSRKPTPKIGYLLTCRRAGPISRGPGSTSPNIAN
jgi:hypothetical protein